MKNLFLFLSMLLCATLSAQAVPTLQQAEQSSEPRVIASYIKNNPNSPRIPFLKQRLYAVLNNDKTPTQKAAVAKPVIAPLTVKKVETELKNEAVPVAEPVKTAAEPKKPVVKPFDGKTQQTVALLNHLFNSDPNSKEAIIQIINKSKCNLIVKVNGPKFYNLNVPASNNNFIMVDKGTYTLTTSVCDAKYSSVKTVNRDLVITLNTPGAH